MHIEGSARGRPKEAGQEKSPQGGRTGRPDVREEVREDVREKDALVKDPEEGLSPGSDHADPSGELAGELAGALSGVCS